jgi:heme/copper-type cytochrome/quinol oxidase subunit 2
MRRITFFGIVIALAAVSLVLRAASSGANPVPEVQVVANKFAFEPAVIQVTAEEPVRLVIHSVDRTRVFDTRLEHRRSNSPKRDVVVEFTAPRAGRYEIACSEFCGSGHRHMKAAVVSVAPTPTAGS